MEIEAGDFLEYAVQRTSLLRRPAACFTHAIMNPPYFKINTDSPQRELIRRVGVETSNIYTGFLAAATSLLRDGGELVAITPRSFCNGPYFVRSRLATGMMAIRPHKQLLLQFA